MKVKFVCSIVLVVAFMLAIAASAAGADSLVCSNCAGRDDSAPFTLAAPAGMVVSQVWIDAVAAPTAVPSMAPTEAQVQPGCLGPFTSNGVVEEGCYEIEGIGTGSVTVIQIQDSICPDIAHIEVCFTPVETVQAAAYPDAIASLPSTGIGLALPVAGFGLAGAGAFFIKRRLMNRARRVNPK